MIMKDVKEFRKFVAFWMKEVDSSEKTAHIKNLFEYLEKLGHRNIAVCMLHEKQLKWATANDLVTFLNRFINDNLNRLEIGDYNFKIATNSKHLRKSHQRLIDTYKNLKMDL